MKQKLTALICALALVLCLAACSGGSSAKELDLTAFYDEQIAGAYELPSMMLADDDTAEAMFPGITALALKQRVMYLPLMNVTATEILLAEAETDDDAAALETIFNERLATLDATWSMYLPEQYELVQRAKVTRTGRFVTLIVSEHQAEIESALADALK